MISIVRASEESLQSVECPVYDKGSLFEKQVHWMLWALTITDIPLPRTNVRRSRNDFRRPTRFEGVMN